MFTRIKLLPILIAFAVVGFGFKVNNVVIGFANITPAEAAIAPVQDQGQQDPNMAQAQGQQTTQQDQEEDTPTREIPDPLTMTATELEVLQDLAARRIKLNEREGQLDMREKLLLATEGRIDTKINRLQKLEGDIQNLITIYQDQENEQIKNLVKVYETMKPKDAAKIMSILDIDIQVQVALRMKSKSIALVMAKMDPQVAKSLTVELATRASLPKIDSP